MSSNLPKGSGQGHSCRHCSISHPDQHCTRSSGSKPHSWGARSYCKCSWRGALQHNRYGRGARSTVLSSRRCNLGSHGYRSCFICSSQMLRIKFVDRDQFGARTFLHHNRLVAELSQAIHVNHSADTADNLAVAVDSVAFEQCAGAFSHRQSCTPAQTESSAL